MNARQRFPQHASVIDDAPATRSFEGVGDMRRRILVVYFAADMVEGSGVESTSSQSLPTYSAPQDQPNGEPLFYSPELVESESVQALQRDN